MADLENYSITSPQVPGFSITCYTNDNYLCVDRSTSSVQIGPNISKVFKNGYRQPGYRSALKARQDATTLYQCVFQYYTGGGGSFNVRNINYQLCSGKIVDRYYKSSGYVDPALLPGVLPIPDQISTSLFNSVYGRHMSKLMDAISPFQGGTFLGELNESVKMLKHPVKSLGRGIEKYIDAVNPFIKKVRGRKSTYSARRKAAKMAADAYASYSYGWKPFISDIDDIRSAIQQLSSDKRIQRVITKGTDRQQTSVSSSIPAYGPVGLLGGTKTVQQTLDCSIRYISGVYIAFDRPNSVVDTLGVGMGNFVPTIWNLIPYSFIVDYFTNLGDLLNAAAFPSARVSYTSLGKKMVYQNKVIISGSPNSSSNLMMTYTPQDLAYNRIEVTRQPVKVGGLDNLPTLQFELPNFGQWLKMGSLVGSRFDAKF